LWGSAERVECRLALPSREASHVAGQLQAAIPEVVAMEVEETLSAAFSATAGSRFAGVELGLASEFMVPLALPRPGEEALLAVIAALAEVGDGELGIFQVLFEACREPWPESMLRAVMTPSGEPFFADAPEITALAGEKVATPIFAVALRVGALAGSAARARELLARIAGGLARFGSPLRNELLPLPQSEPGNLQEDLLARTTHRPGMLLSADELSALIQLPGPGVEVVKLWRGEGKPRGAPAEALGHGLCLGANVHGGRRAEVRL